VEKTDGGAWRCCKRFVEVTETPDELFSILALHIVEFGI
jgi:hypothetical protein